MANTTRERNLERTSFKKQKTKKKCFPLTPAPYRQGPADLARFFVINLEPVIRRLIDNQRFILVPVSVV